MCGGAPKADPVPPPKPAEVAELVLDASGQKKKKAQKHQKQLSRGRAALVTPGLSIGLGGGASAPAGNLGGGGAKRRGRL